MALFEYKDFDSKTTNELVLTSYKLATYANAVAVMGIPGATALNALGKFIGNYLADDVDINAPKGWRELTASELGLPASSVDKYGYFHFASPITGNIIDGAGPQLKLLGEYNQAGKLTRISVSFAGTNDLLDVADYFQLNTGEIIPNMQPILAAVKDFAQANGLDGTDVVITGFSLGAGMVNLMAKGRKILADGFFDDAQYVAHASPLVHDEDVVLNAGFENDVVYRVLGTETSVINSIKAGKPGLVNPDKDFDNAMDNVVLFNDTYASPLWSLSLFSIANVPFGWSAHIDSIFSTSYERLINSSFYEYTHQDSTVILDSLTGLTRATTWVEDKTAPTSSHYGTPAFIIGNSRDNLLKGGRGGDYIDAGLGDDKIKTGVGADRVDGGAGTDTVILTGKATDWQIYRVGDDVFAHAKDGSGLKQLSNVEQIAFDGVLANQLQPYTITETGLYDNRFAILKHLKKHIDYGDSLAGTDGNDTLQGSAVFASAGDDVLMTLSTSSLLHGGEGNDTFFVSTKGSRLSQDKHDVYGAEGNDTFYFGVGKATASGGVGDDNFVIDKGASVRIRDFNDYSGDNDSLIFGRDVFKSHDAVLSAATQKGSDVYINGGATSVVLENYQLSDLQMTQIYII